MLLLPSAAAVLSLVAIAVEQTCSEGEVQPAQIHMVTFGTSTYLNLFKESLRAKQIYAEMHGHKFSVFTDSLAKLPPYFERFPVSSIIFPQRFGSA